MNQLGAASGGVGRADSNENTKGEQPFTEAAVVKRPTFDDFEIVPTVANVAREDRDGLADRLEPAIVEWRRGGDVRALRRALLAALSEVNED